MTVPLRGELWALGTGLAALMMVLLVLALSGTAMAHGALASGDTHDDPTLAELLLTPVVVGIIHVVAMVALIILAYRGRGDASLPGMEGSEVPEAAKEVFSPYIKDEDELTYAFRPNRRMYIVSKNLPHFFVLTGLAAFFSVYTYQWLGGNTVVVYTSVHATAIVVLFVHSALAWRNTWYGLSPRALYYSFGSFNPLAIRMPLKDLDGIEVKASRLKGMLDVSSLKLIFRVGTKDNPGRVNVKLNAIDAPDTIREVIHNEAEKVTDITS
jgi:hypothetical protein